MRYVRRVVLPLAMLVVISSFGASWAFAQEATPVADVLVLVEHNDRVQTIDLGDSGDSVGDILIWGPNPLFDSTNQTNTGATMAGECVTLTSDGAQHCSMTFVFPDDSQLTAQGIQHDGAPSVTVITGGTGDYVGATGRVTSEPSDDLSLYTHTIEFGE